jgi:signal transduction histidine kinase
MKAFFQYETKIPVSRSPTKPRYEPESPPLNVRRFANLSSRLDGEWQRQYLGDRYALKLVLVFAMYFSAGRVGLSVPFTSSNISPIWPASGIAVAAVLLWGFQIVPAITLAAFFANFMSPIPALAAAGIAIGNTASAVLAGYLLRRRIHFQISLTRLRDVLEFALLGALLATTIAPSVGVTTLTLVHTHASYGYGPAWRIWWLGDAMGVLVVAPLLLTSRELLQVCRGWRGLEFGLVSVAVLSTSFAVFGPWDALQDDVLAFVVFPFVMWAAIRFRVAGAAVASFLATAVAVWGTSKGFGPFVEYTPLHNTTLLQVYTALISMPGLLLAAASSERKHIGEAFENKQKLLYETETAKQGLELERNRLRDSFVQAPAAMALLSGPDHTLIFVNSEYTRLSRRGPGQLLGKTVCEAFPEVLKQGFLTILDHVYQTGEQFVATECPLQLEHNGVSESIYVSFTYYPIRNSPGEVEGIMVHAVDVTEQVLARTQLETRVKERTLDLEKAHERLRTSDRNLIRVQEQEQRRLALEVHDSSGQFLVALKWKLGVLQQEIGKGRLDVIKVAKECTSLVDDLWRELRTISYLLHPPLLEVAGLVSALRLYVDGLAGRSGLHIDLDIDANLQRLPHESEMAVFRIVQESLTNIHRHAKTETASVRISQTDDGIRVRVHDRGQGISGFISLNDSSFKPGVGIQGMRERILHLNGTFDIESSHGGTTVIAVVPKNSIPVV